MPPSGAAAFSLSHFNSIEIGQLPGTGSAPRSRSCLPQSQGWLAGHLRVDNLRVAPSHGLRRSETIAIPNTRLARQLWRSPTPEAKIAASLKLLRRRPHCRDVHAIRGRILAFQAGAIAEFVPIQYPFCDVACQIGLTKFRITRGEQADLVNV